MPSKIPKGKPGDLMKDWIGGYFETFWSVNPHYIGRFEKLPDHPVARGVKPFAISDEWYYHMRFADDMKGVTPILTRFRPTKCIVRAATPTARTPRSSPAKECRSTWPGSTSGPAAGGDFGFTGGHVHWNWGNDNFRKVVLNAIVWTAGLEVPEGGVPSKTPAFDELRQNIDKPVPRSFDAEKVKKMLEGI